LRAGAVVVVVAIGDYILTSLCHLCDGFVRILASRPIDNEQKWQIES
jgi:hypothetical protein